MNLQASPNPALSNSSPWFICPLVKPKAETRLFFFPYAGGGPAVFSKWLNKLPEHMDGYIAHYPGRGSRYQEAPIKNLTILVERLYQAVQSLLDKPFAFFGHSMGGLVAFELIRQLRRQNRPQPQILFISACGAPHLADPFLPTYNLSDAEFIRVLQELNGIPSEIQSHSEIINLFLPALRADFEANETYHYISDESLLNLPIIAFGGQDDPRVSRERLEGWASLTSAGFKSQYFPGDHFFINTSPESVIASITVELASSRTND
jgi:surfactin synthase thioesterase subunit